MASKHQKAYLYRYEKTGIKLIEIVSTYFIDMSYLIFFQIF